MKYRLLPGEPLERGKGLKIVKIARVADDHIIYEIDSKEKVEDASIQGKL